MGRFYPFLHSGALILMYYTEIQYFKLEHM
jgi:hypothetical protein